MIISLSRDGFSQIKEILFSVDDVIIKFNGAGIPVLCEDVLSV